MEITAERQGSAVVLNLHGSLTAEADTGRLHELVGLMVGPETSDLVLDLGCVSRLDSFGVGQLVALYNEARRKGVAFMLVDVERYQRRLLEVSGLLRLLPVFDSRQEALTWRGYWPKPRPRALPERSREVSRTAA